jgi:poly-gamma-glutamate capsule biosynthesis protein CapA/YwtB (metallophosphatase superfamily)
MGFILRIFIILLLILASCSKNYTSGTKNTFDSSAILKDTVIENSEYTTIIGVGDIMMGSTYPVNSLPPDDGKYIFDDVSEILSSADVTIGNLEGPLLDKGGSPKVCANSERCVTFRMPVRYAEYLKQAGFDLLCIANNHSNDMGQQGRESTIKTLEENNLGYAGLKSYPKYVLEKNNLKIGFAAFAPNPACCSINNIEEVEKIVKELVEETDIVIVAFHGGAEGLSAQHINRKSETYIGENRGNVYEFAHRLIDAGADIIFGHGPHVTRAIEIYKDRFIAYSLGNFCTYAKFGLSGNLGIAPIIKIFVDKKGEFIKGQIFSIKQIKRGIPVLDRDNKVIKVIKQLTESDFPECEIEISDDGEISKTK